MIWYLWYLVVSHGTILAVYEESRYAAAAQHHQTMPDTWLIVAACGRYDKPEVGSYIGGGQ